LSFISEGVGFSEHSYFRLKSLKPHARLDIALTFKSYSNDGIILFNQQSDDGHGDYVSLAIVHGHVEFRYDLGSGPLKIRSRSAIKPGEWHRVTAKRYQRDGLLTLDDDPPLTRRSPGHLSTLNLTNRPLYIGAIPADANKHDVKRIAENIGTKRGMIGCINRMMINEEPLEISELAEMKNVTFNLHSCGNSPCARNPCLNHATCFVANLTHFHCQCQPGYAGGRCESHHVNDCSESQCQQRNGKRNLCNQISNGEFACQCTYDPLTACRNNPTPQMYYESAQFFSGSLIELDSIKDGNQALSLEIWILPENPDGVIIYSSSSMENTTTTNKTVHADFITLLLNNGHVNFIYDLGSGIANIS
jgi:coxsackievirus/adenovirus receptor